MLELIIVIGVFVLILLWAVMLSNENAKVKKDKELEFYYRLKLLERNENLHNKVFLGETSFFKESK